MKWVAVIALTLCCCTLQAQDRPALNPLKPTAGYVKHLRRYQKLQADKAAAQRKLNDRYLTSDIEAAGLEQYLSRRCQNGVLTGDCVPDGYGVNPLLEMFVPLAPAPPAPKPEPPKPADPPKE